MYQEAANQVYEELSKIKIQEIVKTKKERRLVSISEDATVATGANIYFSFGEQKSKQSTVYSCTSLAIVLQYLTHH